MTIKAENANAICSVSKSARSNAVSMSFTYAVRFFAYCIFYYFYASKTPQRTQTVI